MDSNEPDRERDGDAEYVCEVCGRTFASEADLEDHVHDEGQLE